MYSVLLQPTVYPLGYTTLAVVEMLMGCTVEHYGRETREDSKTIILTTRNLPAQPELYTHQREKYLKQLRYISTHRNVYRPAEL
jgi:hypothetical protein